MSKVHTQTLQIRFVLDEAEAEELQSWIEGTTENLSDELFEKIYTHYALTGEMPYGVAKARTGDPYEWIHNTLCQEYA